MLDSKAIFFSYCVSVNLIDLIQIQRKSLCSFIYILEITFLHNVNHDKRHFDYLISKLLILYIVLYDCTNEFVFFECMD